MEIRLKNHSHVITGYANDFLDMYQKDVAEWYECYNIINERLVNEYDSEIWEMVDSDENQEEQCNFYSFDEIANELMDEIESKAEYMKKNEEEAEMK